MLAVGHCLADQSGQELRLTNTVAAKTPKKRYHRHRPTSPLRRPRPPRAARATRIFTVSAINTMWVLVTAFLVFFMQAGIMFPEAGFARER